MPIVNGHQVETGCYVEGSWGQYGPDRLADRAENFGWTPADIMDDPRYWRVAADDENASELTASLAWERHSETADAIEQWLNDHTASVCTECGNPVEPTDSGAWYRHVGLRGNCPFGFMDAARSFYWHWEDGELFLSESEGDDE